MIRQRKSSNELVIPYAIWRRFSHSRACKMVGLKGRA
jgi:hypothetical protein